MHPARGTTTATETAPARREAAGRARRLRRLCATRLALAAAIAGLLVALAFVLPGGSTPGPVPVGASPVFAAETAAVHGPPAVGPMVAATKPKVTRHVRTPTVNLFTATPATLPAAGGAVHLFAMVARASTCTFSSTKPLGLLPATRSCRSGSVSVALMVPKNTTASPRTFRFQVAVLGPYGPSSAGPVAVVQAAPKQASVPLRLTLEPTSASAVAGSTVTFTAAAAGPALGVQWQLSTDGGSNWSRINGADGPSYSFIAALAENGFRYRAVFTSDGRSATTSAATLTVTTPAVVAPPALPQAVAQPSAPVAAAASPPQVTQQPEDAGQVIGSPVTFTAAASGVPTPTVQWQVSTDGGNDWANITGATSTSFTLDAVTALESGYEYEAVFSNSSGSQTTAPATLTVGALAGPQVDEQPSDVTVTTGSVASFSASASGVPTPLVQWQIYDDGTWTNAPCAAPDSDACSFTAELSENGDYVQAVFSNTVGSATSDIAILTVNAGDSKPTVQTEPSPVSVQSGDTATFVATASGVPTPTVQWELSADGGQTWISAPGPSAESTDYSFTASTAENNYEYRAVFSNAYGSDTSLPASLSVTPVGPEVILQPSSQVVTAGSSVIFTAEASGDPTPAVQWELNANDGQGWGNIANATANSYTVNDATAAESGYQYRAVFTNVAGTVTSNPATLAIGDGTQTQTSTNWSGYVATATGSQFTAVSGDWSVPAAHCSGGGDFYSSDWVGIDGDTDSSVEQDGTESDCINGTPQYYAWYEMYPAATVALPSQYPASAGDQMSASVDVAGSLWTLIVHDATASWTDTVQITDAGLAESSAEWIAERPTVGGTTSSLTDFGSVTFTGGSATLGGAGGTISSVGGQPVEMISTTGDRVLASPGALGGSGGSFIDTWLGSS